MAASDFDLPPNDPSLSIRHGYHHARVHERDVVYHVVSRTYQGRWLLTPCSEFNELVAGIIGRAQTRFKTVELYAYAFMTNHFHLMLRGEPSEVPAFIGYIKRELSRRWGHATGWNNGLWAGTYQTTALPTFDSQRNCLRYVLSQGVKEGAVDRPERWPGVHVAHQFYEGKALKGRWLDGASYAKAAFKEKTRSTPGLRARPDFITEYPVRIDRLPAFAEHDEAQITRELAEMREQILADRIRRQPCGASALRKIARRRFEHRTEPARPPWWERKRRMIVWAAHDAYETRAYLQRYWARQSAFRFASELRREVRDVCGYPELMFSPGRFES
jgi:REP element-mobilizing transposase RayT